ncbi:DUF2934 domain-containing protein [Bradyrhizobium sp. B117]|uniref:DUF2934 domain-containing protein n=1 Tax=Bradyrhizobium sp. B117 TaxID=3140246 RepID=UPI0031834D05
MTAPTEEEIRGKAYKLWKEAGEPEGRSESFWHQAEDQLLREARELGEPPPGLTDNLPI